MFDVSLQNCELDKVDQIAKLIVDVMQETGIKACFFAGHIGTGKTTLIKKICDLIGVDRTVTSPSFAIMNEYQTNKHIPIYHFDFYRINNLSEALDLGITEYLDNNKAYLFIEWSENIVKLLTRDYILVVIESEDYFKRNYKIQEIKNEI